MSYESLRNTHWSEIITDDFELDRISQDLFLMSQNETPKSQRTRTRTNTRMASSSNNTDDITPTPTNNGNNKRQVEATTAEVAHGSNEHIQEDVTIQNGQPPTRAATKDSDSESDDPDTVGLLTQLIAPKRRRLIGPTTSRESILEEFKKTFLDKTTILDRAEAHQSSLLSSKEKGRVPAKLRVTVQPMVLMKEKYSFQQAWNSTIRESEDRLMSVLINHLDNIIATATTEIRNESDNCITRLMKVGRTKHEAKADLKETLKQAEETRKKNKEEAIKRKRQRRERSASSRDAPPAKKSRTDRDE